MGLLNSLFKSRKELSSSGNEDSYRTGRTFGGVVADFMRGIGFFSSYDVSTLLKDEASSKDKANIVREFVSSIGYLFRSAGKEDVFDKLHYGVTGAAIETSIQAIEGKNPLLDLKETAQRLFSDEASNAGSIIVPNVPNINLPIKNISQIR